MKTRLFGKKIENIYDVDYKSKEIKDDNGKTKTVYTDKPIITKDSKVKEWVELCSYDGEPRYNTVLSLDEYKSPWSIYKEVNISENETVNVGEEIFRADLNEMHLHTDKAVETIDTKKEEACAVCEAQIKAFNKMMIESNEKLKAYCDLHKLSYEDTDCIELFKLVFPSEHYQIRDGKMRTLDLSTTSVYTYELTAPATISTARNYELCLD